jgi:hypothetical protein
LIALIYFKYAEVVYSSLNSTVELYVASTAQIDQEFGLWSPHLFQTLPHSTVVGGVAVWGREEEEGMIRKEGKK